MFIEIASFFVFTYIIVNEKKKQQQQQQQHNYFPRFRKKQNISLPQFPVKFSFSDQLFQFLVSAYVEKYTMLNLCAFSFFRCG